MRIAITGTPGTGKSTVAPFVAEMLDCELVAVNDLVAEYRLDDEIDVQRGGAVVVDVDRLNRRLEIEGGLPEDAVVDGHFSHQLDGIDTVIVLRTHPDTLRDRLVHKHWGASKIDENVQAEQLDIILQEAVANNETVYELDTTDRSPRETAQRIKRIVENGETDGVEPGHITWEFDPTDDV